MDTFFKVENEMWKMPAKKHIQTRIVSALAVKRVLDLLSVCPATTHTEDVQAKKETPINYYAAIILNNRNVAKHLWREPQIKLENSFHIWTNIGYICECTLSAMSSACQVTLPCTSYRLQFTMSTSLCCYSFQAEFHKIGSRQHQVFYSW